MSLEKLKNLKLRFLALSTDERQHLVEALHKLHLGVGENSDMSRVQNFLQVPINRLSADHSGQLAGYLAGQKDDPAIAWQEIEAILQTGADWQWAETDPGLPRYGEDEIATLADVKKPSA